MPTGKNELRCLRSTAEESIRRAKLGEVEPYVALAEALMYQIAMIDNAVDALEQAKERTDRWNLLGGPVREIHRVLGQREVVEVARELLEEDDPFIATNGLPAEEDREQPCVCPLPATGGVVAEVASDKKKAPLPEQ